MTGFIEVKPRISKDYEAVNDTFYSLITSFTVALFAIN
jgi:hypothetical protein